MKKRRGIYLILSSLVLSALSSYAASHTLKLASDQRIEVVAYSPYNVVPIVGTALTATQITFASDESIETIQSGDLGAWTASVNNALPYMLFIKPTVYDSSTNMTVVTNKHTYYFELISNSENKSTQSQATYAIHFIYPDEQLMKIDRHIKSDEQPKAAALTAFKNPSAYNWNYSFHGDKAIIPIHVFDDGKFTYMQLQPNQSVPAVFAVNGADANESVVNVRLEGSDLVIQQVAPEFTLRGGQNQVATIFNNAWLLKYR